MSSTEGARWIASRFAMDREITGSPPSTTRKPLTGAPRES
jgi:hypothetical protein